MLDVPLIRFHNLINSIGIDRKRFHELFRVGVVKPLYPVLYGGREELRERMLVKANAYASPKRECEEDCERVFRKYAGRILVPDRVRWTTVHVLALYSSKPLLSNMFYAVRLRGIAEHEVAEAEKALVYWLNTTWGMLIVLIAREETEGAWTSLKMGQWRLLHVLDVTKLPRATLERIAQAFDEIAERAFKRIPQQFSENSSQVDPLRMKADLNFLRALEPCLDERRAMSKLFKLYRKLGMELKSWIRRT